MLGFSYTFLKRPRHLHKNLHCHFSPVHFADRQYFLFIQIYWRLMLNEVTEAVAAGEATNDAYR